MVIDMMRLEKRKDEEMIEVLKRIEKALRQEEGFFIYVSRSNVETIRNLIGRYGVAYEIYQTMMIDLYEIQLKMNVQQAQIFDEIKAEIVNLGIPVHTSRIRLPMTGMITNVVLAVRENDYDYLVIDLSTARNNAEFNVEGTSLTVKKLTGTASIRFNSTTKPAIPLAEGDCFEFEFTKFYLTNSAQSGAILEIFIGRRI